MLRDDRHAMNRQGRTIPKNEQERGRDGSIAVFVDLTQRVFKVAWTLLDPSASQIGPTDSRSASLPTWLPMLPSRTASSVKQGHIGVGISPRCRRVRPGDNLRDVESVDR